MASVWFVPINTVLEDAAEGDYVLTPTEPSGGLRVGRYSGVDDGLEWIGEIDEQLLPAARGETWSAHDRPFRPDNQDDLLRAVEGVDSAERNRGA